ncbi:hypothetical protein BVRB_7g164620 [Beta vulgaris subsp. vulgaris]|nr:hypothetical protein BVRB_7g164620 [Beta vulgaris subsp. vulgaris]
MSHCFIDDNVFAMSSESNRRVMLDLSELSSFLSYGLLDRNRVPCSKAGQSYYNCRPNETANPYERSCTNIIQCQRS